MSSYVYLLFQLTKLPVQKKDASNSVTKMSQIHLKFKVYQANVVVREKC